MSWLIECPQAELPHQRRVQIYVGARGIALSLQLEYGTSVGLILTIDQALEVASALTAAVAQQHAHEIARLEGAARD